MSEIEKMFENAGIENYRLDNFCGFVPDGYKIIPDKNKKDYVKEIVRDFTAEKQLELIKWLSHKYMLHINYIDIKEFGYCLALGKSMEIIFSGKDFSDALANLINALWEKLTEEEQKQIKDILNG